MYRQQAILEREAGVEISCSTRAAGVRVRGSFPAIGKGFYNLYLCSNRSRGEYGDPADDIVSLTERTYEIIQKPPCPVVSV